MAAPVPSASITLYVIKSCQVESAREVSNRLKPVSKPMRNMTIREPYLSMSQPTRAAKAAESAMYEENIDDVVARFRENSAASDLKNTPNEFRVPTRMVAFTRKIATMIQP
jgi:hypothetical protein